MPVELNDELLSKLFAAIHFQPKEAIRLEVKEIIEEHVGMVDSHPVDCANDIVDYLEIERRGNRTPIAEILQPLFQPF